MSREKNKILYDLPLSKKNKINTNRWSALHNNKKKSSQPHIRVHPHLSPTGEEGGKRRLIIIIITIKAASSVERVFDAPQAVVRTSRCVSRCLEDSNVGKRGKFQADRTTYMGFTAVS